MTNKLANKLKGNNTKIQEELCALPTANPTNNNNLYYNYYFCCFCYRYYFCSASATPPPTTTTTTKTTSDATVVATDVGRISILLHTCAVTTTTHVEWSLFAKQNIVQEHVSIPCDEERSSTDTYKPKARVFN